MYSYHHALAPERIADFYIQSKGDLRFLPDNATALVADVERYLKVNQLHHRLDELASIAYEVVSQAQQAREQISNQDEVQQGFGDTRRDLQEHEIALKLQGMDMPEYAAERKRLNVTRTVADFLGGN